MSGRRDIEAGRAYVVLGLKNNLANGLAGVQAQLKTFAVTAKKLGTSFIKVGAGLAGPLLAAGYASAKVGAKLDRAKNVLVKAIEPVIMPIVDGFVRIVRLVAYWVNHNRALVTTILKIGIGLAFIGAALRLASAAAMGMSIILGIIKVILYSDILGPIFLIGVAIGLALAAWMAFTESGGRAAQSLYNWLGTVKEVFGGVVGLLAKGELSDAWELTLLEMGLSFVQFAKFIKEQLDNLVGALLFGPLKLLVDSFADSFTEVDLKGIETRIKELVDKGKLDLSGDIGTANPVGTFSAAGAQALTFGQGSAVKHLAAIEQAVQTQVALLRAIYSKPAGVVS